MPACMLVYRAVHAVRQNSGYRPAFHSAPQPAHRGSCAPPTTRMRGLVAAPAALVYRPAAAVPRRAPLRCLPAALPANPLESSIPRVLGLLADQRYGSLPKASESTEWFA